MINLYTINDTSDNRIKKNNLGVKIRGFQALMLSCIVLILDESSAKEGVGKIAFQPLMYMSLIFWHEYLIKYKMKRQNVNMMKYLVNL